MSDLVFSSGFFWCIVEGYFMFRILHMLARCAALSYHSISFRSVVLATMGKAPHAPALFERPRKCQMVVKLLI